MSTSTRNADLSTLRINRSGDSPRWTNRTKILIGLALLVVAVGGYVGLHATFSEAPQVELTTAIMTYPSQANAVLTASGYVVAQKKASVASKGTGRLVFLGVEEGDRVRKGEVIARLEDSDVLASLAKAKADLQFAIADSLDAAKTLMRQRTLHAANLSSQADLDAAEASFNRVSASILAARAAVQVAEVAVEYTRIRAPFDGTVLTKDADVGEVVAPFASSANSRGAVVTMADMNSLQVEADVSESNITRVHIGQPCDIVLDAYPDRRYQGIVHKIVPTADRAKATVLTKVRFKEKDERVLPEMSAKITFLEKESTNINEPARLTVPGESVVSREGQDRVFRVEGTVVHEVKVDTGLRLGDRIEIRDGLSKGDRIVRRPLPGLHDGETVTVKE